MIAHPSVFRRRLSGRPDRQPKTVAKPDFQRKRFDVARRSMDCYGFGESRSRTTRDNERIGRSRGDDTESDGASLTGPQPYTGEETRVPPVCRRFPLSAGWNLERHARRKSRVGFLRVHAEEEVKVE